jgi:hypothetical protein
MLRRLNEFGIFEHGWAPVLTRRIGDGLKIEYAAYPPWMKSHLRAPNRGTPFNWWFRGAEQPDGTFKRETSEGVLEALPVRLSGSSVIFEIRMESERANFSAIGFRRLRTAKGPTFIRMRTARLTVALLRMTRFYVDYTTRRRVSVRSLCSQHNASP